MHNSFHLSNNNFNPRSHERSDDVYRCIGHVIVISIHAPTRGATVKAAITAPSITTFQSTLPREERPDPRTLTYMVGTFQSTLPREERRDCLRCPPCLSAISIHAPTRGATNLFNEGDTESLFQSTLPREERLYRILFPVPFYNFNPRSHERSDLYLFRPPSGRNISIHAPTRGATDRSAVRMSQ